jgi:endo-1,4-beta-xylanase
MRGRFLATLCLVGTLAATGPRAWADGPACPLRTLSARTAVHVGAAFVEGSRDAGFRDVLVREFDSVTAPLYWQQTEPTPGSFDFTAADAALALAEAHGMRVRGHPLVWGRLALPDYVRQAPDADALRALLASHLGTVVSRYAGRIAQYDVVNEPITFFGGAGTTDGLDDTVFLQRLGPDYVREVLETVHALDPQAKLFINDFLALTPGPKQDRFFRLAADLVHTGAPLDGVGFQGHVRVPFAPGYDPTRAQVEAALARFATLGLAVEVTEADVTLAGRDACQLDYQRRAYRNLLAACLAVPGCTGITTWGITDAFTWIRDFFHVEGFPLPFDEEYRPKPAYDGLRAALADAACGPGSACPAECTPSLEVPEGCCDTDADCDDGCTTGATCVAHACSGGTPVACDDGDPCTDDRCQPGVGCASDPRGGLEGARCACASPPPTACAGVTLPSRVQRRLDRACRLLDRAEAAADGARRRALTRAATELKRAGKAVRDAARRGPLASARECLDAMTARVAAGRAAARAVR